MRKSSVARTVNSRLPVKTIVGIASLKRFESPLQYWSRLHINFLMAQHQASALPAIDPLLG